VNCRESCPRTASRHRPRRHSYPPACVVNRARLRKASAPETTRPRSDPHLHCARSPCHQWRNNGGVVQIHLGLIEQRTSRFQMLWSASTCALAAARFAEAVSRSARAITCASCSAFVRLKMACTLISCAWSFFRNAFEAEQIRVSLRQCCLESTDPSLAIGSPFFHRRVVIGI